MRRGDDRLGDDRLAGVAAPLTRKSRAFIVSGTRFEISPTVGPIFLSSGRGSFGRD